MATKYYDTVRRVELFLTGPASRLYSAMDPDHIELDSSNIYFQPLPAGQQLTYDGSGIPNGTEAKPAKIYTAEEQARIDLHAGGVDLTKIIQALYLDSRGDATGLTAVGAVVDAVVISSGLTLAQVTDEISNVP